MYFANIKLFIKNARFYRKKIPDYIIDVIRTIYVVTCSHACMCVCVCKGVFLLIHSQQ